MTDRPTPPEPDRPDEQAPAADQTAALPQGDPAATAPLPPQPAAPQPAAWNPPAAGPGGTYPPGYGAAASAAPPAGPRRWWGEATSSAGGRAALIAVVVLGSLLLLTGVGLLAALVAGHDDWGRGEHARVFDETGPGMGKGKGNGQGNGNGLGNRGRGLDQGRPGPDGGPVVPGVPGVPANPGNGLGRGLGALGDVLHGEYTTNVTGTPTVMVVQQGQVTAYTAGESLTVRSTDGFEATYALDGAVATTRGGTVLAAGVQVRVVAAKEGMKVTRLVVG
jgi:hypothetical protein